MKNTNDRVVNNVDNVDNKQLSFFSQLETSDVCKKRIDKLLEPKKKKKTLTINMTDAFLEGNLIEMPFITYSKAKELVTKVEYTWMDSNESKKGIIVKGSVDYGVPTSYEYDVLVALFRIYARKKKIEFNDEELFNEIEKEKLIIEFSLNEVGRELGYTNPSSDVQKRIKQAIKTLVETTIYNTFSGGLYDVTGKSYIRNNEIAYHIIEKFDSYDIKENGTTNKKNTQKVCLGSFFYNSIKGSYFKFFNYSQYQKLNSGVAKKLFLILNKWRNNRDSFDICYDTLYERIPIDSNETNSRKKQKIRRAADYLKDVGYLYDYEQGSNKIKFIFEAKKEIDEKNSATDKYYAFQLKYNSFSEVNLKLNEIGFAELEINQIMDFIINNFKYVKALLRYTDVQDRFDKVEDIKNYIHKGLCEKYVIDKKYYDLEK